MPDLAALGPWLRRFLCEHIVTERNLARNTHKSYRDTFSLLLPFISRKVRKPVDRLAVWDLTSGHVLQFLAHLETDRGCSARTRNQRLAAIRAFARFVGSRDPAQVEWCGHIRAIASKRSMPPPVGWLTRAEMEAMLATPDRKTKRGRSEYALLLFLYNTGARVSEATQLRVRDLQIGSRNSGHDLATLHGKGGRTRRCPLWPETERVLADEISGRAGEDAVFVSRLGTPFTRFGVYRLIDVARPESGTGRPNDNPARDPAHHGLPSGPRRRGHQHDPRLARTRLDQHHQHLCRNRPDDEGQRRRALRGGTTAARPLIEGRPGSHGLPEGLVSAGTRSGLISQS